MSTIDKYISECKKEISDSIHGGIVLKILMIAYIASGGYMLIGMLYVSIIFAKWTLPRLLVVVLPNVAISIVWLILAQKKKKESVSPINEKLLDIVINKSNDYHIDINQASVREKLVAELEDRDKRKGIKLPLVKKYITFIVIPIFTTLLSLLKGDLLKKTDSFTENNDLISFFINNIEYFGAISCLILLSLLVFVFFVDIIYTDICETYNGYFNYERIMINLIQDISFFEKDYFEERQSNYQITIFEKNSNKNMSKSIEKDNAGNAIETTTEMCEESN